MSHYKDSYILRDIPPALKAQVQARAKADGMPLRAVLLKLLELYGLGELNIKAERTAP